MKERQTYRDNLELVLEHFSGRKILSAAEAAEFLGVPAVQLTRDKRFCALLIPYGKQRRITVTGLARWMS